MDFILFIKIIAWIGLIVSGLLAALSVYNWYYYECTKAGELDKVMYRLRDQVITGYRLRDQVITGYRFVPRAIVFIVCLAAIISFN